MTAQALAARTGLSATEIAVGLAMLEGEGFAIRGHFDPGIEDDQ